MELLDDGKLEEEGECEGHDGWAVADGERNVGLDHGSAESIAAGSGACLVFVGFPVGFLLPFALEGCPYLPHACVVRVLGIAGCATCYRYEGFGLMNETVNLFLDSDDELGAVRGSEGVDGFDFFGVARVVCGVE